MADYIHHYFKCRDVAGHFPAYWPRHYLSLLSICLAIITFLPFLLIPLGSFTIRGIYRAVKTLIWKERHLSEYILSKDQIQFIDWQEQHPLTPEKGSNPISSIEKVIFSGYIVREMVAYKRSGDKITETAPILYVIYNEVKEIQKLLAIRFHEKSDGLNDEATEKVVDFKFLSFRLHLAS